MIKFSIIVPVYNTYDYLKKCLDSLVNQTFSQKDYEIIIVNDGSTDKSGKLISDYQKKYFDLIKCIDKENGGVSSARNEGVKVCNGEYILFVDSDDYLDLNFLDKLNSHIKLNGNPDLIRIDSRDVKENGDVILEVILEESDNNIDLIKSIMKKNALEVPWGYVYNSKFYKKNDFKFLPQVHEDYGLIPIIIYKAQTMTHLSFIGYNYVEREGSLTAEKQYEKLKKRVDDMFILYCNHIKTIKKDCIKGKLLRGYSLEAMLNKLSTLDIQDMDEKINIMKSKLKASDIYCYNLNKILKKLLFAINIKLYLKLYKNYKMQDN